MLRKRKTSGCFARWMYYATRSSDRALARNLKAAADGYVLLLRSYSGCGFIICPSLDANYPNQWQLTSISRDGKFFGHTIWRTYEDAIRSATGVRTAYDLPCGDASYKVVEVRKPREKTTCNSTRNTAPHRSTKSPATPALSPR